MQDIVKICFKCNGAGVYTEDRPEGNVVHDPCPVCSGEKYLTVYRIDFSKLKTKLVSIENKLDTIISRLPE